MGGLLICVDRRADAAVGEPADPCGMGRAARAGGLRRGRILRRLHEGAAKRNLGLTARQKLALRLLAALLVGVLLLAMKPRRVFHQHERAVLQEFQARSADSRLAAQSAGPIRWRSSFFYGFLILVLVGSPTP